MASNVDTTKYIRGNNGPICDDFNSIGYCSKGTQSALLKIEHKNHIIFIFILDILE